MAHKPRVEIPKNPGELIELTGNVYKHHQERADKSPLMILDEPDWSEIGPKVATAAQLQKDIEEKERELKDLYGQRNPLPEKFTDIAQRSRDVLLGKHKSNPAALGPYGFDVKESPAPKPKSAAKPKE